MSSHGGSHGSHGSSSNTSAAARDAYAASGDPHRTHDPYATGDPYDRRDPYANKSVYDKDGKPKIKSRYGWGHYCDQFFFIQDQFRDMFNSDIELHSEKRDYVGAGDLASVIPMVGRAIGASFFLEVILLMANLFFFMSGLFVPSAISFILLVGLLGWRFFCPSYLIYSSHQYVIGDRMKSYYNQYRVGFKFVEGINVLILVFMLVFVVSFGDFIQYGGEYIVNNADRLPLKSPKVLEFVTEAGETISTSGYNNMINFVVLYGMLVLSYYVFAFLVRRNAALKREENYRESFMRRLSNVYSRKAFILDGEEVEVV